MTGACIHNSGSKHNNDVMYSRLPTNPSELNDICKSLNRAGMLCGRFKPLYYPLAYLFDLACVPCPHPCCDWLRYIAATYLPLTLFCAIILFFKINVASSQLHFVAMICQIIALPVTSHITLADFRNDMNQFVVVTTKVILSHGTFDRYWGLMCFQTWL